MIPIAIQLERFYSVVRKVELLQRWGTNSSYIEALKSISSEFDVLQPGVVGAECESLNGTVVGFEFDESAES